MKMRTVIEAWRKASPLVNKEIAWVGKCLASCRQLLEDMSGVKSDTAKEAIAAECVHELDSLSGAFADLNSAWSKFDESLGEYHYRFRSAKKKSPVDLPGQMVFSDEFLQKPPAVSAGMVPV